MCTDTTARSNLCHALYAARHFSKLTSLRSFKYYLEVALGHTCIDNTRISTVDMSQMSALKIDIIQILSCRYLLHRGPVLDFWGLEGHGVQL